MEFFVPSVVGKQAAEDFLRNLKANAKDSTDVDVTSGRARSIRYTIGGLQATATVGRAIDDETVECILNSDRYMLIFTVNHGLGWGAPILIEKDSIKDTEWFDGHLPTKVECAVR